MIKKVFGYILIIATAAIAIAGTAYVIVLIGSVWAAIIALAVGIINAVIGYWFSDHMTGFKQKGFEKKLPMILSFAPALLTFVIGLAFRIIFGGDIRVIYGYLMWVIFSFPLFVTFIAELIVYFVIKKIFEIENIK